MNHRTIMRRLIWKDVQAIKPLVIAAAVAVALLNVLMLLIWRAVDGDQESLMSGSFTLWILLPNFVALGAPAMLVGTEEDAGTMDWLRTLPVRWQQIATAKLSVAMGAVLLIGLWASLVFSLIGYRWTFSVVVDGSLLLMAQGALSVAFFTVLLVLLGFVTSYSVRSPMMALMALIPIYSFVAILSGGLAGDYQRKNSETASWDLLLAGSGVLLAVWLLQRWLARRRLLLPIQSVAARAAAALPAPSDYRPSALPVHSRPSEIVSLLWQQLRQTGPLCVTLLGISAVSSILYFVTSRGSIGLIPILGDLAPFFVLLSASWFGAIAFYGDTINRRCAFFADRGISPTRVWWTRLLPPAIAFLFLLGIVGVIANIGLSVVDGDRVPLRGHVMQYLALVTVLFAFGQLVSQWSQRPMLAFFAAPAYAAISLMPVSILAAYFGDVNEWLESIVLVVPVLLFASWRLTKLWLVGEVERAYTARVIGYTAFAVLIPCLWIASHHLRQLSAYVIGQAFQWGATP